MNANKISASTLNRVKRWKSAHANAVENFPLFVAGALMALWRAVDLDRANRLMLGYSVLRVLYGCCMGAVCGG